MFQFLGRESIRRAAESVQCEQLIFTEPVQRCQFVEPIQCGQIVFAESLCKKFVDKKSIRNIQFKRSEAIV